MPNLVMLSYHFPPLGGVAVTRALRFARYLPEYGWKPIIVAVEPSQRLPEARDPGLLQEVPQEAEVHRIPCFEPDNYSNKWDQPGQKIIRNLFKTFDFMLVPDDRAGWIGPASKKAAKLVKQHGAGLIWATAQPFSTLMAGLKAAQATGRPLVADFRDDWTTSNAIFRRQDPGRQAREVEMERQVLSYASAVVTVTPGIVEALKARSPHPERVHYLPNGYDPAHFSNWDRARSQSGRRVFLHAGGIYAKRDPSQLLAAFDELRVHHKAMLRFLGRVDDDSAHHFTPEREGVQVVGFKPHRETMQQMAVADLNILLLEQVDNAPWLFTAKVFEYFGARRPLLMIGPTESPLADMVRKSGFGRVCANDKPSILKELTELCEGRWRVAPDEDFLNQFDARRQTAALVDIFQNL